MANRLLSTLQGIADVGFDLFGELLVFAMDAHDHYKERLSKNLGDRSRATKITLSAGLGTAAGILTQKHLAGSFFGEPFVVIAISLVMGRLLATGERNFLKKVEIVSAAALGAGASYLLAGHPPA